MLKTQMDYYEEQFIADMLHGELCRICVSDDKAEIIRMLGFAMQNVSQLAQNQFIKIDKEEK